MFTKYSKCLAICIGLLLLINPLTIRAADLTVSGESVTMSGLHNYENVVITDGTINVQPYDGTAGTGILIINADSIYIDETSSINANSAGYRGMEEDDGEGPGGGGVGELDGGGGGGYGGSGGDGSYDANGGPDGPGGSSYGDAESMGIMMGSGGGSAGPFSNDGFYGGYGGNGGGAIILSADTMVINGSITANGENGKIYNNDATGGGAGGGILLIAGDVFINGPMTVQGGNGGTSSSPLQFIKFTPTQFEFFAGWGLNSNINYDDLNDGLNAGVWIHHAVVKQGANLMYYRDGDHIGNLDIEAVGNIGSNPFYILGDPVRPEITTGYVSDVQLYDRALDTVEIGTVMNGGYFDDIYGHWMLDEGEGEIAYDSSDNVFHGTINNPNGGLGDLGSVWVDDTERGWVASSNGDNDNGANIACGDGDIIPPMTLEDSFTWAFWAKIDESAGPLTVIIGNRGTMFGQQILDDGGGGGGGGRIKIFYASGATAPTVSIDGGAGSLDGQDGEQGTYYSEMQVTIRIEPETLNLKSIGVLTAFISLPEGYDEDDIDISSIECEGASALGATMTGNGTLVVIFDREDLEEIPTGDSVELTVTGNLLAGGIFKGTDTIRVID